MENKIEKIVVWIQEKVKEAKADGVIVGLSGGIDSSCVAALCKKAFPENVQGVIMPCLSNPLDKEHAESIAKHFEIPYKIVDLEESFKNVFKVSEGEEYDKDKHKGLATANIKPRLRMTTLYYFANKLNYLVVGTDNKTESMIGYFTKHGDGGVDILPISSLFKREVRKLAAALEISEEIITKKPSAGLWEGQTDEDEMGLSYEEVDDILSKIEDNECVSHIDQEKLEKVKRMMSTSEHKRNLPPACE
ncbi:NAD+ synthase [Candidatus Woesearchaeota archaeon]|nr:NAD+ synthase [Candidatus Woesearchaeota archaeon]